MDFNITSTSRRQFLTPSHGVGGHPSARLTMYLSPPPGEVALEEFEQYALDRLRVLKAIEEAKARGKKHEEFDILISELWRKHMRTASAADTWRKDVISHFVLRLAYCRTEELRKWFLVQETTLFRHRFRMEGADDQRRFLEEHHLPYKVMGSVEYEAVKEKLSQVARTVNPAAAGGRQVPFEEVPELVGFRRVYLRKGFAYVPQDQLAAIVVGQFRSRLSKALVLTSRKWVATIADDEKDRLTPIVEVLSTKYLGADYSQHQAKGEVSLQDLDTLAHQSFPLCMRHMYIKLKEDHHLRYNGRNQLGLFLKGIGLKLEDALVFWRSEFAQKSGAEKFEKEYAYGIRYNYGKEGKRTDWTPPSCMKIIMSTPGVGDHHGCPYRHFSEENLRAALGGLRLGSRQLDEVVDKAKHHHYQLACGAAFERVHGHACETGINHPLQYYEQSRKAVEGDSDENSQENPSTPGAHDKSTTA
eukprot:jgi/Mesen1/820/ME000111S10968